MARRQKAALYVLVESTFGTDPDTDGSDYLSVPCTNLSILKDQLALIETNYFTGRDRSTTPIVGADGASFDIEVPFIGLSTSAGNGASPPAADWFDTLLLNYFGSSSTVNGVSITATAAGTITGGTDVFNTGDVTMVQENNYPTATTERGFAELIQSNTSPWSIEPDFPDGAGGGAGGTAYGSRMYRFDDDGGATLAFVYVEDDVQYTLLGCRCTKLKIVGKAKDIYRCTFTVMCDSKTVTTKASLPVALTEPATEPVKALYAPIFFGSVNLGHIESVEIDFNEESGEVASTQGLNGRGGMELLSPRPTITVNPPADATRTHLAYKRTAVEDELMVQLGRGFFAGGGALRAGCVSFPLATARDVETVDENNRLRQSVKFQADDAGALYGYCILARF